MIVQGEGVMEWVAERNSGDFGKKYAAIGQMRNGKLIAGVVYDNYNGNNIVGAVAIDEPPTRGFWIAIFSYTFETLGCIRMTVYVEESNTKSMKLMKKLGFEREGTLKMAAEDGTDVIMFCMWKSACRMLDWRRT